MKSPDPDDCIGAFCQMFIEKNANPSRIPSENKGGRNTY